MFHVVRICLHFTGPPFKAWPVPDRAAACLLQDVQDKLQEELEQGVEVRRSHPNLADMHPFAVYHAFWEVSCREAL